MSKWTHAFRGPGDNGESVVIVTGPSSVTPETLAVEPPRVWTDDDGDDHLIQYVGSGRGDWWQRTANPADPLVTPWLRFFADVLNFGAPKSRVLP